MQINTTYNMDALAAARLLPDGCVDCIVTSPPYYGLRDYGVDGQIGLEETPEVFIDHLVTVFRELWRVLKPEGTLWVNMGDSYAGSNRGADDVKPKDLIGIPWMLAFALRTDGWYLRQDIIWHKPNPMPESVTDRCTKAHEYIFLFSKSARYYFDAEAIKEPATGWNGSKFEDGKNLINHPNVGKNRQRKPAGWDTGKGGHGSFHRSGRAEAIEYTEIAPEASTTRNKRSVWTVPPQPFKEAHFATFPEDLIVPPIAASITAGGWIAFARTEAIGSTTASSIRRTSGPTPPAAGSSGFSPPAGCPSFSRRPPMPRSPPPTCSTPALSGARFVTCWTCTTRAPAYSAAKSRWWMQPSSAYTPGW